MSVFLFFLSNLAMGASAGGGSALVSYVDPTAVSIVSASTPSDVDPTAVTVIDTPSADSDVDPTQVTIIQ